MAGNGSDPHRSVVSKVAVIVRSFGDGRTLSLTEVVQITRLPTSTAHRLLHELTAWGVLHRRDDGRFSIVLPAYSLDDHDHPSDLRTVAAPAVDDLGVTTRSDVRLGVLDGLVVSYMEKPHGARPLTTFSAAATLPAHATALGRALLAFSPPEATETIVRHGLRSYTVSTVTTAARLRHALKAARLNGLAVVCGELRPDHSAVAAPVFGPRGDCVAALEVRLGDGQSDMSRVAPALTVAARALSRELGRAVSPPASAKRTCPQRGIVALTALPVRDRRLSRLAD